MRMRISESPDETEVLGSVHLITQTEPWASQAPILIQLASDPETLIRYLGTFQWKHESPQCIAEHFNDEKAY